MKKRSGKRSLSELEGAALAVVARAGACTAYAVKEAFRASPSEYWSGSAGAVYPLMRRLEAERLFSSRADGGDGRGRRLYRVTPAGGRALRAWLTDAERAAEIGLDPLRTRLFFSDLLTPAELRGFIAAAGERLAAPPAAPAADLPHAVHLHNLWMDLRRRALAAFARGDGK